MKKRRSKVLTNTSNKSSSSLILIVSLSQIYSQTNKKVISNVKQKGLGSEKIQIK